MKLGELKGSGNAIDIPDFLYDIESNSMITYVQENNNSSKKITSTSLA